MLFLTRSHLRRARGYLIAWQPLQWLPDTLCKAFSQFYHLAVRVHPEDKLGTFFIPAIEFSSEGEIGISAQGDLAVVGFDPPQWRGRSTPRNPGG
tara:strand:+ start:938 stop:1222 length:285 start_codon:yes stop_codon:yes gene_type:complete